jgi:class I fructose-bisphosphate aldolase
MGLTDPANRILGKYESDNPGTKANLAMIPLKGRLGGTEKLLILPVDQRRAAARLRRDRVHDLPRLG